MNTTLLQILPCLLFLFFLPVIIHSKKSCPASSCVSNSFDLHVKYPFKLDTDHNPKFCQDYITLRCSDRGQTILDLPFYGDFHFIVDSIEYDSQRITLKNPDGCLPRRLMTNHSLYPLKPLYTEYTFYTCPRAPIESEQIPYIECMSNSTNVTIAPDSSNSYYGFLKIFGCEILVSLLLPFSSVNTIYDEKIPDVVVLTWNVSDCEDCINYGNDGYERRSKFVSSPLFIPLVVVLVAFFGLSFLLLLKFTSERPDTAETGDNTTNTNGANTESTTTGAMTAAHNEANSRVDQDPNANKPCTKIIVVDDTHSTSLPNADTSCCSICLEAYLGKDTVRYLSQCGHYFHAQCVDQWLQKNTTCPVCRDKLSGSNL